MKRMTIDSPVEIILNGHTMLFEPGDVIIVESEDTETINEEETINEASQLEKFLNIKKKLYINQSDIEKDMRIWVNKIEKEQSPSQKRKLEKELETLRNQKAKVDVMMKKINNTIRKVGGKFTSDYLRGNVEESEAEEKAKRAEEMALMRNAISNKVEELEKAKSEVDDFIRSRGYEESGGRYVAPDEEVEGEYRELNKSEMSELEDKFAQVSAIEDEIDELQEDDRAGRAERDEEGEIGDFDTGLPEMTDSVITPHELYTQRTSTDPYDDAGEFVGIGDIISSYMINYGFQPKDLGQFSDMIKDVEAA